MSQTNYTITNYADHTQNVMSHDAINHYLRKTAWLHVWSGKCALTTSNRCGGNTAEMRTDSSKTTWSTVCTLTSRRADTEWSITAFMIHSNNFGLSRRAITAYYLAPNSLVCKKITASQIGLQSPVSACIIIYIYNQLVICANVMLIPWIIQDYLE